MSQNFGEVGSGASCAGNRWSTTSTESLWCPPGNRPVCLQDSTGTGDGSSHPIHRAPRCNHGADPSPAENVLRCSGWGYPATVRTPDRGGPPYPHTPRNDPRRALVELARIGAVARDALEIIDGSLSGRGGSGSVEEWETRVERFPFEARGPLGEPLGCRCTGRGLDSGAHNPEVADVFLRYRPGTTERYADGTRAAYSSHLNEWLRWLSADPGTPPAGR